MRLRAIHLLAALALATACDLSTMKPGARCGSCHASGGEARRHPFGVAGTVFASETSRDGLDGALVEIIDARGARVALRTNRAGNFFTTAQVLPPLQVTLSKDGARAAMPGTAPTGDCNGCHAGAHAVAPIHLRRTR